MPPPLGLQMNQNLLDSPYMARDRKYDTMNSPRRANGINTCSEAHRYGTVASESYRHRGTPLESGIYGTNGSESHRYGSSVIDTGIYGTSESHRNRTSPPESHRHRNSPPESHRYPSVTPDTNRYATSRSITSSPARTTLASAIDESNDAYYTFTGRKQRNNEFSTFT